MHTAASHAIESLTGDTLGAFLSKEIWLPLGMSKTFWTTQESFNAERTGLVSLARGYAWNPATQACVEKPLPESGSGAMISKVLDYAHWLRCT